MLVLLAVQLSDGVVFSLVANLGLLNMISLYFLLLRVYMCICVEVCAHEYRHLQSPDGGVRS